jgi:predicted DNA-binding transcriptional regulator AlpA
MTNPNRRLHRRKPPPSGQTVAVDVTPIHPNHFYRAYLGPQFFGLAASALDAAIKAGHIPAPIHVVDGGKAKGWLGSTILQWQAQRMAQDKPAPRKSGGAS